MDNNHKKVADELIICFTTTKRARSSAFFDDYQRRADRPVKAIRLTSRHSWRYTGFSTAAVALSNSKIIKGVETYGGIVHGDYIVELDNGYYQHLTEQEFSELYITNGGSE